MSHSSLGVRGLAREASARLSARACARTTPSAFCSGGLALVALQRGALALQLRRREGRHSGHQLLGVHAKGISAGRGGRGGGQHTVLLLFTQPPFFFAAISTDFNKHNMLRPAWLSWSKWLQFPLWLFNTRKMSGMATQGI
jgi:hypothetical protein